MLPVVVCPILAALLLITGAGSPAAPVAAAVGPGAATTGAAPLAANATAVDMGGNWNCGQGHETFNLFGQGIDGAPPYRYVWNFGDGSPPSSAQDPVHSYQNVLQFTANLTVTDASNHLAVAHVSVAWGIPLDCTGTGSGPLNGAGVWVYLGLVVAVAVAIALTVRRRRRQRPLP